MIQIEKNVPLPMTGKKHGRPRKYPFEEMKVGDSFFVPAAKAKMMFTLVKRVKDEIPGFAIATRTVEGGVRVWRIA